MCGEYVWRIIDSFFVSAAYQRRMCGKNRVSTAYVLYVCATYVSLLWNTCDVLGILGIFCGVPGES